MSPERRRRWEIALDWHLSPYYGKPRQGTKHFHAYATACIVSRGERYTLALTWVRRHESLVTVLLRLIARIRVLGLKIRCFLLDRAFFTGAVAALLQDENIFVLTPVVVRGRRPKKRRKATGLRWIKQQAAGWYKYTLKDRNREIPVRVCVGYRGHRPRKDRKQAK